MRIKEFFQDLESRALSWSSRDLWSCMCARDYSITGRGGILGQISSSPGLSLLHCDDNTSGGNRDHRRG
jgi:hypothetical protein